MITRASNVLWRAAKSRNEEIACGADYVGLPVGHSALSAASALGATRVGERLVGRGSLSDGQRPILILAASCDRLNRCRNWCACFRAQGATRGKRLRGSETAGKEWRRAPRRDELKLHPSETAVNDDVLIRFGRSSGAVGVLIRCHLSTCGSDFTHPVKCPFGPITGRKAVR